MTTDPSTDRASAGVAPLWATFTLTWVNNLGAATALIAVYFIAKARFGFSPRESLMLGLLQGVTYIVAALAAGAGSRLLAGPGRALSTRALLAWIQVLLAAVCFLPLLSGERWAAWALVGIYSPLTGWLWPVIESFFSAGRSGAGLRRAASAFNLSWASSQVVTFWAIAPFLSPEPPDQPLWLIAAMGLSHLACLPVILALPREPGAHGHAEDASHSPVEAANFARLLACFRALIVLSYVVYSAMNPLLPTRLASLGIAEGSPANSLLASIWMLSRVVMFFIMGQWGSWHGSRRTLAWSSAVLLAGFIGVMLAPTLWMLAVALAVFGVGMGAIYSAAFYYAMEVGSAAVDAGGKHEALIGLGYSAGPIAGLAAEALIVGGLITAERLPLGTVGFVALMALLVLAWVGRRAARPIGGGTA